MCFVLNKLSNMIDSNLHETFTITIYNVISDEKIELSFLFVIFGIKREIVEFFFIDNGYFNSVMSAIKDQSKYST